VGFDCNVSRIMTFIWADRTECGLLNTNILRVTGLFPGGKPAGAWRWPPTSSSAEVKERVGLYLFSPSGRSWPVLGWPLRLSLLHLTSNWCRCWFVISSHFLFLFPFVFFTAPPFFIFSVFFLPVFICFVFVPFFFPNVPFCLFLPSLLCSCLFPSLY